MKATIKVILDRECYRRMMRSEMVTMRGVFCREAACQKCHKNDALAQEISAVKERKYNNERLLDCRD